MPPLHPENPVMHRLPSTRTYAWLDAASFVDLDAVATLARGVRTRGGRYFGVGRLGAASIAAQCLNTLRGDLCDGTLEPGEVPWRDVVVGPGRGGMLHMMVPGDDLVVIAESFGVDLQGPDGRPFVNGVVGFAI